MKTSGAVKTNLFWPGEPPWTTHEEIANQAGQYAIFAKPIETIKRVAPNFVYGDDNRAYLFQNGIVYSSVIK